MGSTLLSGGLAAIDHTPCLGGLTALGTTFLFSGLTCLGLLSSPSR